jgi:hypothetical protein
MKRLAKNRHRLLPHYISLIVVIEMLVLLMANHPFG